MKILLVEAVQKHIDAAENQLQGHELTIVNTYHQAQEKLDLPFDVLLTDAMIPLKEDKPVSAYGLALALNALQKGIKHIGILTDGTDAGAPTITFSLDEPKWGPIPTISLDIRIMCITNILPDASTYVKDWATFLHRLVNRGSY